MAVRDLWWLLFLRANARRFLSDFLSRFGVVQFSLVNNVVHRAGKAHNPNRLRTIKGQCILFGSHRLDNRTD